jgi:hypothetical protein
MYSHEAEDAWPMEEWFECRNPPYVAYCGLESARGR